MAGLVWPLRLIRRRDQLVEVVSSQVFASFGIEPWKLLVSEWWRQSTTYYVYLTYLVSTKNDSAGRYRV